MTNDQKSVRDWMLAFRQECPEKPTLPSKEIRLLRAKLILEEALETIDALGVNISITDISKDEYQDQCKYLNIKDIEFEPQLAMHNNSLRDIADGCEDIKVVTEGTLVACGLTKELPLKKTSSIPTYGEDIRDPLFDEVMRSNWTKLWSPQEVFVAYKNADGPKGIKNTGGIYYWNNLIATFTGDKYLVKDKDGKVIKSPSYLPVNLNPIIELL